MIGQSVGKAAVLVLVLAALVALPVRLFAHCDTLDGPVIAAARKALDTGNVNLVLIWVQPKDEAAVREAFQKTRAIRRLGPAAKELVDMYFFETLVRLHRAGEGAAYTGLKPAGLDLGPAVPAADRAVATGSVEELVDFLKEAVEHQTRARFKELRERRNFGVDEVQAGREYIASYVEFVHFVERIYESASGPAHGHYPEAAEAAETAAHRE